jgi:hypothetical protein
MDKKSAISRKPNSQKVDAFINKGLQSSESAQPEVSEQEQIARVQLRLSKSKLREIDESLNQRKVKVSRRVNAS